MYNTKKSGKLSDLAIGSVILKNKLTSINKKPKPKIKA